MDTNHLLLLGSFFFRAIALVIFVPVLAMAYREARIKDLIFPLRISIVIMIGFFIASLVMMEITTYCRWDHCYNETNLDLVSFLTGIASFFIALVLLLVYRRHYEE